MASIMSAVACAEAAPDLLELESLSPRVVEARDTLELLGEGFPLQSEAKASFDGVVHRSGDGAHDLRVDVAVSTQSRDRATLRLTPEVVRSLLGERTHHATFRGDVRLAFAPKTKGAPPITGTLRGITLDVFGTPELAGGDDSEATPALVAELTERFGWTLERDATGAVCLTATNAAATPSPLAPRDCIERFDGVNVLSLEDLVPSPGRKQVEVFVRRPGLAEPMPVMLTTAGLRPRMADAWLWSLVGACLMAAVVLACRGPLSLALSLVESALSHAFSAHAEGAGRRPRAGRHLLSSVVPFASVSGLFAAAGLGLSRTLSDFDLLLVYGGCGLLLSIGQLLGGGQTQRGFRVGSALAATLRGLVVHLTILFAIAASVLQHASLSMLSTARSQGALLWEFDAFSSPGAYLACASLSGSVVLLSLLRWGVRRRRKGRARVELTSTLLDTATWMVAGLLIVVYLGGWQVPQFAREWFSSERVAGLLLFQLKLTLVFSVVTWLRSVVPSVTERTVTSVFLRWLLPAAVLSTVLDLIWISGTWPGWLQAACTWTLVGASLLLAAGSCVRLLGGRRTPPSAVSVNPWL